MVKEAYRSDGQLYKAIFGCWRHGSVITSTCCSCRGPRLSSKNPHAASTCLYLRLQGLCRHLHIACPPPCHHAHMIKRRRRHFYQNLLFFFCSLQVKNNILISNTVERKGYLNPSDSACFCFIILQLVVVSMRMPPTGSCIWTPGPQWMALMEGYRTFRSWRLVEELHQWGWGEPGGFTAWILFLLSLSDPCVWLRCDQSAFSCSHVFPDCCPAFLTWWTISPQEL